MKKRMLAWVCVYDAHGPSMDSLCFLPEGDRPETEGHWRQAPWLDEPKEDDKDRLYYEWVHGCGECPYAFAERNRDVCTHPAAPDDDPVLILRGFSSNTTPPKWCPLRSFPTIVKLAGGA